MMSCTLCPRNCNVNRANNERGFCGAPANPVVAAAMPHMWEEPCISGTHGSGTIFFSGCNLACTYCQNHEISRHIRGRSVFSNELRQIFVELTEQGVHNINLVTPTCYADKISEALTSRLSVPVLSRGNNYPEDCTATPVNKGFTV
ncbi:MAG: 4Fe-4S cluster-binding domain-containing protein [Oscillospiraceae bacterium]|jgi:putative pyruvate formate lyase activating enzyme|nr:4Fe-4S cluster-binding domain-containing protein [Oscillospiraceae bacterium]